MSQASRVTTSFELSKVSKGVLGSDAPMCGIAIRCVVAEAAPSLIAPSSVCIRSGLRARSPYPKPGIRDPRPETLNSKDESTEPEDRAGRVERRGRGYRVGREQRRSGGDDL